MSTVYNPESEMIAQIENLEIEARNLRHRMEKATRSEDKKVLAKQLKDTETIVESLRHRIP